jgi:hypothetical protein
MPAKVSTKTFLGHILRSKDHGLQQLKKGVLPMSIQGSLENLMKVFLTFYIGCCLIGRPDIPLKLVAQLRTKALAGTTASWGCPSIFNHSTACATYDPRRYK